MSIGPRGTLLVLILLSSGFFVITVAGILLALKYRQSRSRPYLFASCCFLFQSLGVGGSLLISLMNGYDNSPFEAILRPADLINGFLTLYFSLAYIVEIKFPGKLTLKSFLIGISPFIIMSTILVFVNPCPLHSSEEVFNGIKRPDVWIRLIILFFFIAYPVVVACMAYDWHQCMVSRQMVTGLHVLICLASPAFIAGMMCGYLPAVIVNYIITISADSLITYIELRIRIPVTGPRDEQPLPEKNSESIFDNPEIWQNPDMTVTELASMMGTNHTYLLKRIKALGYSSYSDMINQKRVEYICKGLQNGKAVNIINLMFDAGFRFRSTASREFKRIVGCTPSEYRRTLTDLPPSNTPYTS